ILGNATRWLFTSKSFSKYQSCARQKPRQRMTETQLNAETFVPPGASHSTLVPGTIANTRAIPEVCGSFAHPRKLLAGQTLQSALRPDKPAPSRLAMHRRFSR